MSANVASHFVVPTVATRASRKWEEIGRSESTRWMRQAAPRGSNWEILELDQLACGRRQGDGSQVLTFMPLRAAPQAY